MRFFLCIRKVTEENKKVPNPKVPGWRAAALEADSALFISVKVDIQYTRYRVLMSILLRFRSGRSCCLACVSSTHWCKRGVSLVLWVGIYRTASTSPTYESASDSCRCVMALFTDKLYSSALQYKST